MLLCCDCVVNLQLLLPALSCMSKEFAKVVSSLAAAAFTSAFVASVVVIASIAASFARFANVAATLVFLACLNYFACMALSCIVVLRCRHESICLPFGLTLRVLLQFLLR